MNRILAVFPRATDGHFYKDVFQFPLKVAREENAKLTFLSNNNINKSLLDSEKNLELINVNGKGSSNKNATNYIKKHAKKFDLIILFHVRDYTLSHALLYLKINNKGKVIIKGDRGDVALRSDGVLRKGILRRFKERIMLKAFKPGQLTISYETDSAKLIASKEIPSNIEIIRTYNGHDINEKQSIIPFQEKNNVFLIVGSIGDKNKNHVLIIDAIRLLLKNNANLLNDWNFKFVGPIVDKEFAHNIETLKGNNSYFREHISLLGNQEKDSLYKLYNESKYMIISSKREGSPLVIPESLRFGNVILSTPVSSVSELIHNCGYVADSFDVEQMSLLIKSAIMNVKSNAEKSQIAYFRGLNLHWDRLEYNKKLSC